MLAGVHRVIFSDPSLPGGKETSPRESDARDESEKVSGLPSKTIAL